MAIEKMETDIKVKSDTQHMDDHGKHLDDSEQRQLALEGEALEALEKTYGIWQSVKASKLCLLYSMSFHDYRLPQEILLTRIQCWQPTRVLLSMYVEFQIHPLSFNILILAKHPD